MRKAAALAALAALSACGGGGQERTISTPLLEAREVPDGYATVTVAGQPVADQDIASWWRRFDDPVLTRLATETLAANTDIAQAAQRLAQADARVGQARAARLPQLGVSVDAGRTVLRDDSVTGPRNSIGGAATLGWDLDLFGRLSKSQHAARAELAAAGYDLASVQRAVVAEVATNYVQYRGLTQQIKVTEEALRTQTELADTIEKRFDSGIAVRVDVEQARLQLLQVQAVKPQLDNARNQVRNRIAVLTGRAPADLGDLLDGPDTIPLVAAVPPTGVPADLLRRRPDVLAAEQRVLAAGERIGVARAALYPQLSLEGSLSVSSFSFAGLADSIVGSLIGRITQTLFDGGRNAAVLRESKAAASEAVAAYRGTVLTALEDVENALSATDAGKRSTEINEAAVAAAERNVAATHSQYDIGLVDLFILLNAEQQLLNQRDALITARVDRATAMIQLYGALGGGWQPPR